MRKLAVFVRGKCLHIRGRRVSVRGRRILYEAGGVSDEEGVLSFLYKGSGCSYVAISALYGDGRCSYKEGGFSYEGAGGSC